MKTVTVTVTFQIDCKEYGEQETAQNAVNIARTLIEGNVDLPDQDPIIACEGVIG